MRFISGEIMHTTNKVLFSSEENSHYFCFIPISSSTKGKPFSIPCENNLVFGQTFDNRHIAMYYKEDALERGDSSYSFYTNTYMLSKPYCSEQEFKTFEAINFYGGSVNKIFSPKALPIFDKISLFDDPNIQNDEKQFSIETKDGLKIDISIHSLVTLLTGHEGRKIDNSGVKLTFQFAEPQPINEFLLHYRAAKNLLEFMTYRQNVGFDKISLKKANSNDYDDDDDVEVFINSDVTLTNKDYMRCISVETLGDSFPELVKFAYANNVFPSLGFFPENDLLLEDMHPVKLKEICSAVEHEINNRKNLNEGKNKDVEELSNIVIGTIKKYIKNHNLASNDYSSIMTSVGRWSLPLKERIVALYEEYEKEINLLSINRYGKIIPISYDKAKEFVQYRNDITHNASRPLNQSICTTAFLLSGLVYCCILDRIGMPRDKIKELCNGRLLY